MIWKNKNLSILFSTQLLSRFGDSIETIAFIFLVLKMTGSALSMAGFVILNTLPNILFAPIAGVLADRLNRKVIMVVSEVSRALIIIVIAMLYAYDMLTVYHIYIAGFMVSIFESFFSTCKSATIPNIVKPEELGKAESVMQVSYSLAQVISLGFAGVIVAKFGYTIALTIDAISFFVSAVAIAIISNPQKIKQTTSTFVSDFVDGFNYVKLSGILIYIMIAGFFVNFFIGPVNILIPLITKKLFGGNEASAGYLFATLSLGLLIGSLAAYYIDKIEPKYGRRILFSTLFLMLGIAFGIGSLASGIVLYMISFLLMGFIVALLNVSCNYIFQKSVTDEYRGRASSLLTLIMLITMPLSVGLSGGLLEKISISTVFFLCAIAIVFFSFVSLKICPHCCQKSKESD